MDLLTAHTEVMDHAIRAATTTRIQSRLEVTGIVVSRYGLVAVLLLIGVLKFTPEEAAGIQPLVAHSPLMSWMYGLLSVQGVSNLIGAIEIATAALMALRSLSPKASFVGSSAAVVSLHIGGRVFQPAKKDWIFPDVIGGGNESEIPLELVAQPSQVSNSATDVFVEAKAISNAEACSCLWHKLHQSHGALLGDRIRIPA